MDNAQLKQLLKQRIESTRQSSERQIADEAYTQIFQARPTASSSFCDLPIHMLRPFFTADIGFHPYSPSKLKAFSEQLTQDGLFERIIVRPIPNGNSYEILAGHNRTNAARLAGWDTIPCEVVEADDERAITIAIATNLMRRQDLTIIERGQAYKTLLDAKNRQGYRRDKETSGDSHQKYSARQIVAEFFGVTEYEIRKAIKLTQLIPQLAQILEQEPRKLSLACAEMIADYNPSAQEFFLERCQADGCCFKKSTMQRIACICPAVGASKQSLADAWHTVRMETENSRLTGSQQSIVFDRKKFIPYLHCFQSDDELEQLFLQFLKQRLSMQHS